MTEQADDRPLPGAPVDLPLPPAVCEAFGYRGPARYVAFCWSPFGDEVEYSDGESSGSGNRQCFHAYKRHRAVAPLLAGADLGSSEREGTEALLIDRVANRASIAPVTEARAFLREQWPPELPLSEEQRESLQRQLEEIMARDMEEARADPTRSQRLMDERRGQAKRMIAWLDMCPEPPERGLP